MIVINVLERQGMTAKGAGRIGMENFDEWMKRFYHYMETIGR